MLVRVADVLIPLGLIAVLWLIVGPEKPYTTIDYAVLTAIIVAAVVGHHLLRRLLGRPSVAWQDLHG